MAIECVPAGAAKMQRLPDKVEEDQRHKHYSASPHNLQRSAHVTHIPPTGEKSKARTDIFNGYRFQLKQKSGHIDRRSSASTYPGREPQSSTSNPNYIQNRYSLRNTAAVVQQTKKQKRTRGDEVQTRQSSPEPSSKRVRRSAIPASEPSSWKTINEARIDCWRKNRAWPTEEEESKMLRFQELVSNARAKKRSATSPGRKRSNASVVTGSVNTDTPSDQMTRTQTSSDQKSREQKSAPYKHPLYETQLKDCGSFMKDYEEGISNQSKEMCEQLLKPLQTPPAHTLFSDDSLFEKTCDRLRSENETRVVRDIALLIVPSAEILADMGEGHLEMLKETTNACWTNAIPFIKHRPGQRPNPRPQPDFGLGFQRDAFTREQLDKLEPFIGYPLTDSSFIAATYNMYLPFLTSEVKCGAVTLDIADRQNAYSQSVALRGLAELFRLVGRENELHREIKGFSVSHSDSNVRIWGHYIVIRGKDFNFYRHLIADFHLSPTAEGDQRHFESICSVIDMLPVDLNFEVSQVSEPNSEPISLQSGLSQQVEDYDLSNESDLLDHGKTVQEITPDATIRTESSQSKRTKK